ncbi:unnamed protein product, partial [Didymodactylos carnosus]
IAAYLDPFTLEELFVEEIDEAESLITNEAKICGAARQQPTTTTPPPQQQSSSSSITITKRSRVSTINQFKSSCHRTPAATQKSAQTQKPLSIKEEFSLYISTNRSSKDFETYWNEKQNLLPILSSFHEKLGVKISTMSIVIPHWLRAALIGAAPMLGIVFLILFVFTILGLVQRLKTIITRTCINFKKQRSHSLASNGNKGVTIRITDDKTNNIQTVINKDDDDSNHEEYQQQLLLNEQSNPINYDHLNSIPMIDIDRSLQKLQEINTNEDDKSSVIQLKIRSSKSDGKLNESIHSHA